MMFSLDLDQTTRWLNKVALASAIVGGFSFTASSVAVYLNHRKYDLQKASDAAKDLDMQQLRTTAAEANGKAATAYEAAARMDEERRKFEAEAEIAKLERERIRQENLMLGLRLEAEQKSRLELERKVQPRHLSDDQRRRLTEYARNHPAMAAFEPHVSIDAEDGVPFAEEIVACLRLGGWQYKGGSRTTLWQERGLSVIFDARSPVPPLAKLLHDALTHAGISHSFLSDPSQLSAGTVVLFTGGRP